MGEEKEQASKKHVETSSEKILNNKYNSGELDYEAFGEFVISESWVNTQNTHSTHDNYESKMLYEDIYRIFKESYLYEKYYPKIGTRVKKDEIMEVFNYINDNLKAPERYTFVEKVVAIADFMNINYKVMYSILDISAKEKILDELNDKYDIFKKKNIKKLF
jgi:hypothetical protein